MKKIESILSRSHVRFSEHIYEIETVCNGPYNNCNSEKKLKSKHESIVFIPSKKWFWVHHKLVYDHRPFRSWHHKVTKRLAGDHSQGMGYGLQVHLSSVTRELDN